jgi:hypothetical protein
MRFFTILSLVSAALAAVTVEPEIRDLGAISKLPETEAGVAVVEARAPEPLLELPRDLQGRACTYNGCKCKKGVSPGVYCGSCAFSDGSWVVTKKRVADHAFQCAKSGDCCSYGYRKNCLNYGESCPE